MAQPGTKIVAEDDSVRTVDNVIVKQTVIHWNDTAAISVDISVDIDRDGEFVLLTGPESLDDVPDDAALRDMISDYCADPTSADYADYN